MAQDDGFREMPLEVRVSGEAIAEIYGVRDFFGNYATPATADTARDEQIWDEMRAVVMRARRPGAPGAFARRWRWFVFAVGAGIVWLTLSLWWAR